MWIKWEKTIENRVEITSLFKNWARKRPSSQHFSITFYSFAATTWSSDDPQISRDYYYFSTEDNWYNQVPFKSYSNDNADYAYHLAIFSSSLLLSLEEDPKLWGKDCCCLIWQLSISSQCSRLYLFCRWFALFATKVCSRPFFWAFWQVIGKSFSSLILQEDFTKDFGYYQTKH